MTYSSVKTVYISVKTCTESAAGNLFAENVCTGWVIVSKSFCSQFTPLLMISVLTWSTLEKY